MKIANSGLDITMSLHTEQYNQLILENPIVFRNIVCDFIEMSKGGESNTVISDGNSSVKWKNNIELILNPFVMDINDKKILKMLYSNLASKVSESELQMQYADLNRLCNEIFAALDEDDELSFRWNEVLGMNEIFKIAELKIDSEEREYLSENIVDYIDVCNKILGTKLFIFINLKDYLLQQEIAILFNTLKYQNVYLLDVESREKYDIMSYDNTYIVDYDRCVIT